MNGRRETAGTDGMYGCPVRVDGAPADLFLTLPPDEPGQIVRPRPVVRFEAGDIFIRHALPFRLEGCEARIAPLPDGGLTTLDRLDVQDLYGIDQALRRTAASVGCGLVPANYRQPNEDAASLQAGEVLSVSTGLVCLELESGQVRLLGREDSTLDAPCNLILQADTWLVSCADARLRVIDPHQAVGDGWLEAAIARMQGTLLRVWLDSEKALDLRVRDRIDERRTTSGLALQLGLRRLAASLGEADEILPEQSRDDALQSACLRVARHLGADFPRWPRELDALPQEDRLRKGIEAARLRCRRVALREKWWENDAGPMVAFLADDSQPVALLPKARSGYLAYLAGEPHALPLDANVAARLAGFAYSLFRTLPERRLGLRDLLAFGLVGQRGSLLAILAFSGLLGLMGLLMPLAMGHLFDAVIPNADRQQLVHMAAVLAGVGLAMLAFSLLRSEVLLRLETRLDASLQAAVWDRVLKLPVAFFREHSSGDLANRVNAVNEIQRSLSGHAVSGLLTAMFSLFNLALLFHFSPSLALAGLCIAGGGVAINAVAAYLTVRFSRDLMSVRGKLASEVLAVLSGIAKIRVAAAESRVFSRWAEKFSAEKRADVRVRQVGNVTGVTLSTYTVLANAVLYYLMAGGSVEAAQPGMTTGEFVAFSGTLTSFMLNLMHFSSLLLGLLNVVPLVERARPILEACPEIEPGRAPPGKMLGGIRVSNLTFRYQTDGPLVLDDVSFVARPGEFIAVVGPSGSGKSTVMRMLLGFETPASGAVYFDGRNLADLDPRAVRSQFGVVLQSSQLMTGDIFQNIVGTRAATLEDAWEAARLCGLDADIESMPMGMHTLVNEGASTLSGGQRQRILIARSVVQRPRILLFDEATSALDNRTQALVARSVERLKATRIVIAHRLSTIEKADRILVMHRGKIVQTGTYSELMAVPGLFRDLASRQLSSATAEP